MNTLIPNDDLKTKRRKMPRNPLNLTQLLERFIETLFRIAEAKSTEIEANKAILRSLLKQNLFGIRKELLEQEHKRDQYYRHLCQKRKLEL
jgi:hypothetical protein